MAYSMFLLDRSKPGYFVCCGFLHAKMALLGIIIYTIFIQVINAIAFILTDDYSSWTEIIFEIYEYLVTICLLVAFVKEISIFLLPYIFQMFVAVALACIITLRVAFCVILPYSNNAEELLADKSATTMERIKMFLMALAVLTTITTFLGWCLHVGLMCYKYFDARNAEKLTKASRPPVSFNDPPPLVVVNPKNATSFENPNFDSTSSGKSSRGQFSVSKDSFPNPNFSIADDDDDEIFDQKGRSKPMN